MPSNDLLAFMSALGLYVSLHSIIISALFWLRRQLPKPHAAISGWWLVATAAPLIGPLASSIALAKLARRWQTATADVKTFRSDCGHGAGISYGLVYFAAGWTQSSELGCLALTLMGLFFWQAFAAHRAVRLSLDCGARVEEFAHAK